MYYAFDVESNPKELLTLIKSYFDNTKMQRKDKRCYLFLDEIPSVKNWQKGIKKLWDQGRLKNCTVVATGSHAIDLKNSTEKLPGRRESADDVLDKVMYPIKFSEFVPIVNPELDKVIKEDFTHADNQLKLFEDLINGKMYPTLEKAQAYMAELNQCLLDYMITGGIPMTVNQYTSAKMVKEETYTNQLNAILGDLNALNKSVKTFRQILKNMLKTIGLTSSWRSLKKNTDIGSENTISQYVNDLEDMFIISVLYQYDAEKKKALYQKEKKIYFQDPFYFHVLNSWISGTKSFDFSLKFLEDTQNQGKLVESVVASHIIRLAFMRSQNKQMFVHSNYIYHWKYYKGKKVDLVYNDGMGLEIPIEVKFQNHITKRDLDGIISFKKQTYTDSALCLTKDILSLERECIKIPVSMFLLLI